MSSPSADTVLEVDDQARRPRWLGAAGGMWLRGQFFGGLPPDLDSHGAFMHLVVLTRTQASAERAFARLVAAQADNERATQESKASDGIDAKLRIGGEMHAFLVSAHLFWRTFDALRKYLRVPELQEAGQVVRADRK